jgi:hypothetical protein
MQHLAYQVIVARPLLKRGRAMANIACYQFKLRGEVMKNLKHYLAVGAFALMILSLPAIASAQWRNDDYYGNNRGGYYNGQLQQAVQDLKQRTRNFERQTDHNGGYGGGYGGYRNTGDIEDLADQLAKAANRLENRFGRGRNLNNSRDEAQRVVSIASQIASMMGRGGRRNNSGYYNGNEWYAIDQDVRIIANAYGLNYNPRGYRNNRGGWGNTRQTNRQLPSWWPF